MTITSPIDIEPDEGQPERDSASVVDELSLHDDVIYSPDAPELVTPTTNVQPVTSRGEPAMAVVYLGIISLIAILVASGLLAL